MKSLRNSLLDEINHRNDKHKKNAFGLVFYFLLLPILIFAIFILVTIFYVLRDLPSIQDLKSYKSNFTTRIYSRDGELLNNYASENRIFIPIEDVPEVVKMAFLAAEDSNFYSHHGIDISGILNAAYKNAVHLITGDGYLVGASTITQQVVKNILLSKEKTLSRKLKEIFLSLEVSREFSKDEVFEIYLNHIFFGSGAYGVMAASIEYFGKSVKDLSIQEAALLAALPKAPSDINPRRNKERAFERRNWVLHRMMENHFITDKEYQELKEIPLVVVSRKNRKPFYGINSFADYVKTLTSSSFGSDTFFSNGYYIKTTLDHKLQKILYDTFRGKMLEYDKKMGYRGASGSIKIDNKSCFSLNAFIEKSEIVDVFLRYAVVLKHSDTGLLAMNDDCEEIVIPPEGLLWSGRKVSDFKMGEIIVFEVNDGKYALSQMPDVNGGAMIMDPKTGEVLAMIGDFYDRPNGFNRAISAKRQLGSGVKPFVYMTALEHGFTPASTLIDEDLKLADEWQPRNDSRDFLGVITLRTALERSRNVATVRLAEMLGVSTVVKRFEDFKLNADHITPELSTVLGSFNVTVERVASAFSTFVNKGRRPESSYILKIQDQKGKTIFVKDGACDDRCSKEIEPPFINISNYGDQMTSEDVAFQVLSILEGATQRGTARALSKISSFGIAGKTGSTSDHKDAWFAGLTNNLAIVIYIGNDKSHSLGARQYGSVLALPFFSKTLSDSLGLYPITPFDIPNGIEQIQVDYNTGEVATENSKRTVLENFKRTDKKPKKPLSKLAEDGFIQDSNENTINEINRGVY